MHSQADITAEPALLPTPELAPAMERLLLRLMALVGGMAALLAVAMLALPRDRMVIEIRDTGLAGAVLGALLVALAGLAGTLLMAMARLVAQDDAGPARVAWRLRRTAGRPQGVAVGGLALAAIVLLWWLRPLGGPTLPPQGEYLIAGAALLLAFPLLLAERTLAATKPAWLPEAPWLQALVFLPLVTLAIHAVLAVLDGLGADGTDGRWDLLAARLLAVLLGLVAVELVLRALAQWFLPPPPAERTRAAADSLLARLAYPGGLAASGLAAPLRETFGIDVSRSWALAYLRAAALPMLVATLAFCWGLTGLRLVGLDQRAVYQRLGVPVAVLQPGLHLILPWPLGTLRGTELGVVHALPLGPGPVVTAAGKAGAEDASPAEADRLWDQTHQNELSLLIASAAGGRQSFQTVSLDGRVLYRIGLDDAAVLRAVYGEADPQALVRSAAGRLLAHVFAGRTLTEALGESREALAAGLRTELQADLDAQRSGIELLAVVIESIHPPAGAAEAYHQVQAAEIAADTSVSTERGQAVAAASYAQQQAHDGITRAQAAAAERITGAGAELTRFAADQRADRAGGAAFLLERYFADLSIALARAPLVILDHRLGAPDAPVIDLRPLAGAAAPKGPLDED
jgi:regulator of protease activity HflC (stomatin/prohibitin superfamily)